jgi:hypothetical protein
MSGIQGDKNQKPYDATTSTHNIVDLVLSWHVGRLSRKKRNKDAEKQSVDHFDAGHLPTSHWPLKYSLAPWRARHAPGKVTGTKSQWLPCIRDLIYEWAEQPYYMHYSWLGHIRPIGNLTWRESKLIPHCLSSYQRYDLT